MYSEKSVSVDTKSTKPKDQNQFMLASGFYVKPVLILRQRR